MLIPFDIWQDPRWHTTGGRCLWTRLFQEIRRDSLGNPSAAGCCRLEQCSDCWLMMIVFFFFFNSDSGLYYIYIILSILYIHYILYKYILCITILYILPNILRMFIHWESRFFSAFRLLRKQRQVCHGGQCKLHLMPEAGAGLCPLRSTPLVAILGNRT